MINDTLKTTLIGSSSAAVISTGWLPEVLAIIVGALTAVHLLIKIFPGSEIVGVPASEIKETILFFLIVSKISYIVI